MGSSTEFSGVRGWGVIALVLAASLGMSGCSSPDDPTQASGTSSASPTPSAAPTSSAPSADPSADPNAEDKLGPTEQPVLPVVEGGLDEEIDLTTGMTITLGSIDATEVEAETPGDVAGAAVAVIVTVTNTSTETQSVDSAVVTLETADGEIGIPTIAGGASPLGGDVAPGSSVEGRYLFMLDPVSDREVTISVNYAAGEPVAKFIGRTP